MTVPFTRADTSILGRWWWTVDRWSLVAIAALMAFGALLAAASSPAVAERIGLDALYFIKRHFMLLPVSVLLIIVISAMSPIQVRRFAVIAFLGCLVLLAATLLFGVEIKGARRWLSPPGFSLQVTEFVKPTFAVVAAWLFAEAAHDPRFPGGSSARGSLHWSSGLSSAQPRPGTEPWSSRPSGWHNSSWPDCPWLVVGLVILAVV